MSGRGKKTAEAACTASMSQGKNARAGTSKGSDQKGGKTRADCMRKGLPGNLVQQSKSDIRVKEGRNGTTEPKTFLKQQTRGSEIFLRLTESW